MGFSGLTSELPGTAISNNVESRKHVKNALDADPVEQLVRQRSTREPTRQPFPQIVLCRGIAGTSPLSLPSSSRYARTVPAAVYSWLCAYRCTCRAPLFDVRHR